jgi:flagellar biosynthesis protein FlhG
MEIKDQIQTVRRMARMEVKRRGRLLAVMSGKGGVGKTNIALNLSLALAAKGKKVVLVDADTRLGNVDLLAGIVPGVGFDDVLFGEKSMPDLLIEDPSGLRILPVHAGGDHSVDLDDTISDRLVHEMGRLRFDAEFVLVDAPAGLSNSVLTLGKMADDVVVVTTPEPTAVSNAYALVKVLSGLDRNVRFGAVVNWVRTAEEAEEVHERFSLVTGHFLGIIMEYWGYLLEDRRVRDAVQKQNPFVKAFPRSKASLCIQRIAERILS